MTYEDGAKRFRQEHGQLEPGEQLPTRTAMQRGKLAQRAAAGDVAARRALATWQREKNEAIRTEQDARTRGLGDA